MDIFDFIQIEHAGIMQCLMNDIKASFISTQVSAGEYYYLNLTPKDRKRETVVCGGREQCTPAYRIERTNFKYYSIEFVSSGRGLLTKAGITSELRPGAVYSYGPKTAHTIVTDPSHPMLKHFVDFTGTDLVRLLRSTDLTGHRPLYVSNPFRIRSIFENLITTGNNESQNRDALCALLLRQLILLVDDSAIDAQSAFSPAWQTYLRCRQHMERNFLGIAMVSQLAEACHVDPAYLARLFKRFAGETPLQLLTRLKMGRAADLLGTRKLLVKEVAEAVGFTDPYHFSRVFKRVYGIPPEAFTNAARREG
jgi:AraC-like DNA-binding protein